MKNNISFVLFLLFVLVLFIQCKKESLNVNTSHSDFNHYKPNLFPIIVEDKTGFINKNGVVVINPIFLYADRFWFGLSRVLINLASPGDPPRYRTGYINENGNYEIPHVFGMGFPLDMGGFTAEGRAIVCDTNGNLWGAIDRHGTLVIPFQYEHMRDFHDGFAIATNNWESNFINPQGQLLGPLQYHGIHFFNEGLAPVCVANSNPDSADLGWGYIDETGTLKISPQFGSANSFSNGLALVGDKLNNLSFIDKHGKKVFDLDGDYANYFFEGRAVVRKNGKWGFIDKTGNWIVQPMYDMASWYSEGLAVVINDSQCGYINVSGNIVIPMQYMGAGDFLGGLAGVTLMDSTSAYIRNDGTVVWKNISKKKSGISFGEEDQSIKLARRLRYE